MMSLIRRWLFRPGSPKALAVVRIATNGYFLVYLARRWKLISKTASGSKRDFKPVGVARPMKEPLPVNAVKATTAATYGTTALAGLGAAYPIVGPLNAALSWWTITYRNSWSMIYHSDNQTILHLAVLGTAPAADAWSVDAALARRRGAPAPGASWQYGWPIQTINALTALTYFISGVAKLAGPLGWRWASGEHLRSQVAVDGVRKAALRPDKDEAASPYVEFLERYPRLWTVFAVGSLVAELGAPVALFHPKLGRIWALSAWSMHVGIKLIMQITFRYQLSGVPYVAFAAAPAPALPPAR